MVIDPNWLKLPLSAWWYAEKLSEIKKVKKLSGRLIIVQWGSNFVVGISPVVSRNAPESKRRLGMECIAVCVDNSNLDPSIRAMDTIKALPPQDIVKYLPWLTDAGVEYLKELKI
jgi:hypothetical protein